MVCSGRGRDGHGDGVRAVTIGRHNGEPFSGLALAHEAFIVAVDHLRTVAGFKGGEVHVLGKRQPVAAPAVSEAVLDPEKLLSDMASRPLSLH